MLAILSLLFTLASCGLTNCKVAPDVEIIIEKDPKTGEEKRTTTEIIKKSVNPGGKLACDF